MTCQTRQPDRLAQPQSDVDLLESFVRWAAAQLNLDLIERPDGACELVRRTETPDGPTIESVSAFCWPGSRAPGEVAGQRVTPITGRAPLVEWFHDALQAQGPAVHARPKYQPSGVHDFSNQLFSAYTVENGNVHLGGCLFDDRPFLRLTYRSPALDRIEHYYFNENGTPIDTETVQSLGLNEIVPAGPYPPRMTGQQMTLLVHAGQRHIESVAPPLENGVRSTEAASEKGQLSEPIAATIIWAKHVTGKLRFTIGETFADLPFEGWARMFVPPPFHCEASGVDSFHLGATDDGRIVAADEIATCDKSGKRVVRCELVECSVSGQHVLEKLTRTCPVSGQPALQDQFTICQVCQQEVSNIVLKNGICQACRQLIPVPIDDPRIVWLLGEYPGLDRFRKWQLSETESVYIAQAATWWKRLLVVIDKETSQVHRLAHRSGFGSRWTDLEPAEREELLEF
ncbi:MAG: hypothetical protein JW829_11605 [Pirellulales bacterium]|nr:hypothetical protein [Pirellulales bacterium]